MVVLDVVTGPSDDDEEAVSPAVYVYGTYVKRGVVETDAIVDDSTELDRECMVWSRSVSYVVTWPFTTYTVCIDIRRGHGQN